MRDKKKTSILCGKKVSVVLTAFICSGQVVAQASSPDLFGIGLLDHVQRYNADLYGAQVDFYTGPSFMQVDILPPLQNSNIGIYTVSYKSQDGQIHLIQGFEYYADFDSCVVAVDAIQPIITSKFNIVPTQDEFASGTTYNYGFFYSSEMFEAAVACVVQSGNDTTLIVDLKTQEYVEAMNLVSNQF